MVSMKCYSRPSPGAPSMASRSPKKWCLTLGWPTGYYERKSTCNLLDFSHYSAIHLTTPKSLLANYPFQYTMEWFIDNCPLSKNRNP